MKREQMLAKLSGSTGSWDVLVIGGGATGLGIALDSASRGYRTALVEAADFAKGTSSRSTKLIHGGVRYLRQGRIGMVRQSLLERGRLLRNAAPIVHPLNFVIPTFRPGRRWYFYAGLKAYDLLAGKLNLEPARLLNSRQTGTLLPTLATDQLQGGVVYGDGQFDDAGLALAIAGTAARQGAILLNYTPVVRLLKSSNKTTGVVIRELERDQEHEIRAKVVINATGVFAEQIMELDQPQVGRQPTHLKIAPSQGTHLVLSRDFMPGDHAMMIPDTDDGRVLFAIPWMGHTLLGTTDIPVSHPVLEPKPQAAEIDYLLEHASRYFIRPPQRRDVLSMFAGLRPLVRQPGKATAQLSREHEIDISPSGIISVIGGKWTTYRRMGEDVVDLAARLANLPRRPSATADLQLIDSALAPSPAETNSSPRLHPQLELHESAIAHAVEHQMARCVEDVLARRSRSLFLNAAASVAISDRVAELMRDLLGRDEAWRLEQVAAFRRLAIGYQIQD